MPVNKAEMINNKTRIKNLLERLRTKLRNFAIVDMRGKLVGHIADFSLEDNRNLKLIASPSAGRVNTSLFSLSSRCIQKVDTSNRAIFVDLSQAELARVPVNQALNNKAIELPAESTTPARTEAKITNSEEIMDSNETHSPGVQFSETEKLDELDTESFSESDDEPEVVEEEMVRLLEERLVVNRSKRKVGEVVVRKEIETRIVEVPIQREKLIIEQVGEEGQETKQLAEIDLGEGEVTGVDLLNGLSSDTLHTDVLPSDSPYTVTGEFISPQAASNLLEAIALQGKHGCAKVRVQLVLDDPELQETYQKMFDRCSGR